MVDPLAVPVWRLILESNILPQEGLESLIDYRGSTGYGTEFRKTFRGKLVLFVVTVEYSFYLFSFYSV